MLPLRYKLYVLSTHFLLYRIYIYLSTPFLNFIKSDLMFQCRSCDSFISIPKPSTIVNCFFHVFQMKFQLTSIYLNRIRRPQENPVIERKRLRHVLSYETLLIFRKYRKRYFLSKNKSGFATYYHMKLLLIFRKCRKRYFLYYKIPAAGYDDPATGIESCNCCIYYNYERCI